MVKALKTKKPQLGDHSFVAESADVIGNVCVGNHSSVWYGVVMRGDVESIKVGENTNIQDNSTIHTSPGNPVIIGNGVTIGHGAVLHSCKIGNNSLIGIGTIILDGACIGDNCIIGANSLVNKGTIIPDGMMAYGSPAKIVRALAKEEIQDIRLHAEGYTKLKEQHRF